MPFFYLSQVRGQPVVTLRGDRVARVKDLVARLEARNTTGEVTLEAYPPVAGLVVEIAQRLIFVPWPQVEELDPLGARLGSLTLNLRHFKRREGEVLLARDMLDKQLIDIDGRRVVRANDIQLYGADGSVRVTAVDVSAEALLRRLSFGKLFAGPSQAAQREPPSDVPAKHNNRRLASAKLINWADVEPLASDASDVRLRLSHERLALLHPVDIAHILDDLSYKQGVEIIESLDDETAADTLQEMGEERQADIVESLDQERAADILEEMDPDDAADLLADLDRIQAQDLLRRMDREEAEDVEELLAYPEDSAAGIMTSDFLSLPGYFTADEAIALVRSLAEAPDRIDYVYVVEAPDPAANWAELCQEGGGKMTGTVSLRDLLLAPGSTALNEIMETDLVWIRAEAPAEEAARLMAEYNLTALPVLGKEEHMLGIITVDDAMDVLLPERRRQRLPHVFS